jgi:hypothetical protein
MQPPGQQAQHQPSPDAFAPPVARSAPQAVPMNPPPPQYYPAPPPPNRFALSPQPPVAQPLPNQRPELLQNLQHFPYGNQLQQPLPSQPQQPQGNPAPPNPPMVRPQGQTPNMPSGQTLQHPAPYANLQPPQNGQGYQPQAPPGNPYPNHQRQGVPNSQGPGYHAPYSQGPMPVTQPPFPPSPQNVQGYPNQPLPQTSAPYTGGQGFANPRVYPNPQAFPNRAVHQGQYPPPGLQGQFPLPAQGAYPGPYVQTPFVRPPNFSTRPSISPKLKILLAVMVVGAGILLFALKGVLNKKRLETIGEKALTVKYLKVPNADASSIEAMRENLLQYLGKDKDPRFGYDELQRQLFAGVDELAYDQEKGEVLMLVNGCSDKDSANLQRVISNYTTNPALTFYGEAFKQKLNAFHNKTALNWTNHCPLLIPADNIRVNPYTNVEIKYSSATYKISLQELSDFMTDKSVYGGHMRIFSKDRARNELNVFGNHGAFVARAGEPSLTRLSTSLAVNATVSGKGFRENRIQKLVDFVSQEITYDESEAKFKGEILKRPDETLLTRRGDCSSKSILLASLLEQIGEEYRLVYYNDHITVAVRKGNFPNLNNLSFTRDGETWMIAESTLPGFQIGETIVENAQIFAAMRYVQKPGNTESVSALDDLREIVFE